MQCGRDGVVVGRIRDREREGERRGGRRNKGGKREQERFLNAQRRSTPLVFLVWLAFTWPTDETRPPLPPLASIPSYTCRLLVWTIDFHDRLFFKLVSRGKSASSFSRFSSLLFLLFLLVFLFFSSGVGEGERNVFVEVIDKARLELYHSLEERYGGYLL